MIKIINCYKKKLLEYNQKEHPIILQVGGSNPKEISECALIAKNQFNYDGINIHSRRMPGYVAHHEVVFGSLGETLTIRHDSIDRKSFMQGVIESIRSIHTLQGFVYGLDNIL